MPGPGRQSTRARAHGDDTLGTAPASGLVQSLTVPGHAREVPRARAFIAGVLAAHGLPSETACLLGGELVTNSVQHSNSRRPGGTVTVRVIAAQAETLVEVTDNGGGGVPLVRDGGGSYAENGRGLVLVSALSARWGFRRAAGHLTTWFEIPAGQDHLTRATGASPGRGRLIPLHPAEPAARTFRTPDGLDADLFNLSHYPVGAICQVCGKKIEADSFLRPFGHVEEQRP